MAMDMAILSFFDINKKYNKNNLKFFKLFLLI